MTGPNIKWPCGMRIYIRVKPGTKKTIQYFPWCCYLCAPTTKWVTLKIRSKRKLADLYAKKYVRAGGSPIDARERIVKILNKVTP